jgi:hypothetical protein
MQGRISGGAAEHQPSREKPDFAAAHLHRAGLPGTPMSEYKSEVTPPFSWQWKAAGNATCKAAPKPWEDTR